MFVGQGGTCVVVKTPGRGRVIFQLYYYIGYGDKAAQLASMKRAPCPGPAHL